MEPPEPFKNTQGKLCSDSLRRHYPNPTYEAIEDNIGVYKENSYDSVFAVGDRSTNTQTVTIVNGHDVQT